MRSTGAAVHAVSVIHVNFRRPVNADVVRIQIYFQCGFAGSQLSAVQLTSVSHRIREAAQASASCAALGSAAIGSVSVVGVGVASG